MTAPNISAFGNSELPELYGFDIHESQLMYDVAYSDTGWTPGVYGFAGLREAMLFVSRIPNDYNLALPGIPATAAVQVVTEPDTGISVLFSKWVDNAAKQINAECAVMYQAAQGHPQMGALLRTSGVAQN
jgi:hypothetical protein